MYDYVVINGSILNQPRLTGLGVYTVHVLRRLLPRLVSSEITRNVVLLGSRDRLAEELEESFDEARSPVTTITTANPLVRVWALNRAVAKYRRKGSVLYYSPTHHGVVLNGLRQVVTIHDLFALRFPKNYRMQHYYFRWYVPWMLRHTDRVIADSESTAVDCQRYYRRMPPSEVVHLGLRDDLLSEAPEPVEGLESSPFFLFVGPTYFYKNCDRLISAFALFVDTHPDDRHRLVFAGGSDDYLGYLQHYIAAKHPHLAGRIDFPGYVSGEQLTWLYQHATAAAVTTLYEGFGLPALEAMAVGCPVIASNLGSLLEVCGTAALMVDPYDGEAIAGALAQVAGNPAIRSQLVEKGRANAERFSWDHCAERVFNVLAQQTRERSAVSRN